MTLLRRLFYFWCSFAILWTYRLKPRKSRKDLVSLLEYIIKKSFVFKLLFFHRLHQISRSIPLDMFLQKALECDDMPDERLNDPHDSGDGVREHLSLTLQKTHTSLHTLDSETKDHGEDCDEETGNFQLKDAVEDGVSQGESGVCSGSGELPSGQL